MIKGFILAGIGIVIVGLSYFYSNFIGTMLGSFIILKGGEMIGYNQANAWFRIMLEEVQRGKEVILKIKRAEE